MTPADRRLRAQLAANARWAKAEDRTTGTAAARRARFAQFEAQVDPDNKLPAEERARRAESAMKAHMARMALASSKARRTA